MAEFETIAELSDSAMARVLVAALRAHGFSPLGGGEDGLPGLPGVIGPRGIRIAVPAGEAHDAGLLARILLREMSGDE